MVEARPLPLPLADAGYLSAPGHPLRFVWGLDRLMRAAHEQGAELYWASLRSWGYCYCWSRIILLDPDLVDLEPWEIRRVIAEELGHVAEGRSERRALDWSSQRFGSEIEPLS